MAAPPGEWKLRIILVGLIVGGFLLFRSCTATEARPGSPEVYEQIESSTSCEGLQETFDRASANFERSEKGSRMADVTLSYMTAADDRMREIGCFG